MPEVGVENRHFEEENGMFHGSFCVNTNIGKNKNKKTS